MADPIPDGMTELYDADVPRVDLVDKGANGMPFLIAKSDEGSGLFDADYVRDLIAKSEPEPKPEEMVTMTGSPAAIAEMIHKAAVRQAQSVPPATVDVALDESALGVRASALAAMTDASVEKAEASVATMNDRPDSDFAYVEDGGTKDESGKTIPRSLRHYPIYDEAHTRNALGRAGAQIEDGDDDSKRIARAALPKIRAAAKKFGIEVEKAMEMDDGINGMDPTVILAEPNMEAAGDPMDPGSPAWEAIDAATARKWTSILARTRTALQVMADRENLEAAAGDETDMDNAMDLCDAACAIDYAISVLAPFAVDEQAEADCGTAEMEMLGKAVTGMNADALETVEALAPLTKAGRTLSAANEAALRAAITSLQQIIASLPAAPVTTEAGKPVAKTANEEPNMDTPTPSEDVTAASGQEPAMGSASAEPKPVAGQAVTDMVKTDAPVTKASAKPDQMAVYDSDGNLIGAVDPADLTRFMSTKTPAPAETGDDGETDGGMDDDTQMAEVQPTDDGTTPTDLAPAPADAVGTPADATTADDDGNVAKAENPNDTVPDTMLKSSISELVKAALDEQSAEQAEFYKGLEDRNRALEERNEALIMEAADLKAELAKQAERLTVIENQPAVMAIASNGAIPAQHQMRGQDRGAPVGLTKGQEIRQAFRSSDDAARQQVLAKDMNAMAIEELARIHAAGPH